MGLGLINYEGNCLRAIKSGHRYLIKDQYGKSVGMLEADEVLAFVAGYIDITDSRGKLWNCKNENKEAIPKLKEVYEFLGMVPDKKVIADDILERTKDTLPIPSAKDQLIDLLYSQMIDLSMMSKIELGDDVIAEIKRLKHLINEHVR
jgi:UDP-galactopyranose mutase